MQCCIPQAQSVLLFALLLYPVAAQAHHHAAEPCKVLANSTPPLSSVQNGTVTGFSMDLLRQTLQTIGRDVDDCKIASVPWVRGMYELEHMEHRIMFSVAKTAQREPKYKWAGPIYRLNMSLIGKKSKAISVTSYSALKHYRIATLRQSAPEQWLISRGVPRAGLERAADNMTNLKKLHYGRVDLVAHVFPAMAYEMRGMGIDPGEYEEVFILKPVELYYAFSKDTSDTFVQQFQTALDALKAVPQADGKTAYQHLLSRYQLPDTLSEQ